MLPSFASLNLENFGVDTDERAAEAEGRPEDVQAAKRQRLSDEASR